MAGKIVRGAAIRAVALLLCGGPALAGAGGLPRVTEENVRLTVPSLLENSEILRELAEQGRVRVVPALYDVASGRVSFLE